MVLHSILLGGLLLGADDGWQPLPDGEGMEYLIQLSPQDIEAMKTGEPWRTNIPSSVENVRAYRVTIGNERLERIYPPPTLPPNDELPPAVHPAPEALEPEPGREPQLLPERQAVHMTPKPGEPEPAADSEPGPAADQPADAEKPPPRPWLLLVGTALALAGSLGGNAYLLWVLRETHQRYRSLAETRLETPLA